jgi:hypothetical protein
MLRGLALVTLLALTTSLCCSHARGDAEAGEGRREIGSAQSSPFPNPLGGPSPCHTGGTTGHQNNFKLSIYDIIQRAYA